MDMVTCKSLGCFDTPREEREKGGGLIYKRGRHERKYNKQLVDRGNGGTVDEPPGQLG
jgi:hypothetical protein